MIHIKRKMIGGSRMNVVISNTATNYKHIYHRANCFYTNRIKYGNRFIISYSSAKENGMCACKYCSGYDGEIRTRKDEMKAWEKKYNLSIMCKPFGIFVFTNIGCWKIWYCNETETYVLFHKNFYDKSLSHEEAIKGKYHRQADVKETESLERMISYIANHDKAKIIMVEDYRKLPQDTRAQKKYYRQAQNRARRSAVRRVDSLFALLESNNPELKRMTFC